MKIAVSALGSTLDSPVDARFGRCAYFLIVDVEGKEIKGFEAIQNTAANAIRGAGVQAAQTVLSKGAEVVLTGNIGPNAFALLQGNGVKIVTGIVGISVKEAVERYLRGELSEASGPTTLGFGRGPGMGFGR